MRILYFDAFSGVSGDKIVAALSGIINDEKILKDNLLLLSIKDEFEIEIKEKNIMGISSNKFNVNLKEHTHNHSGDHDHHHHHEKESHHHHRHLQNIIDIIKNTKLDEKIINDTIGIFKIVAQAESKVHNVPIEKIHFHEVGAVDSIVDILSTAILINEISPDKIISSFIPVGKGFINVAHGRMPVPAPATAEILRDIPVYGTEINTELTTPTGAAIIKYYVNEFSNIPEMNIEKTGYGAGTKDLEIPNILRVFLGENKEKKKLKTM